MNLHIFLLKNEIIKDKNKNHPEVPQHKVSMDNMMRDHSYLCKVSLQLLHIHSSHISSNDLLSCESKNSKYFNHKIHMEIMF